MALLDETLVRLLPAVPRPLVRKLAEPYIAGSELLDACRVVRAQNAVGRSATIDVLGESISNRDEARAMVEAYLQVLGTIERESLDSNVSVKPTAFGLELGYDACRANVEEIAVAAASCGNFVRVEMEGSRWTDETLRLYRELREAGHENVGVVFQSQLRRTLADVDALAPLRPNVRLVKGIYVEPPELAFEDFDVIRVSYARALQRLLRAGCYVGIATHDDWLVAEGLRLVEEQGLGPDAYEFQLLLGVRESLADELVREGHRVRIYVPYGRRWYEYSLRRLQENPKLATFVALDTLKRVVRR